nr:BA14K family protein [Microvirga makkahensis]
MLMALAATAALGTFGLSAPASAAEAQAAPINELVAAIQKGEVKSDYVQRRRYVRRYYAPRRYYGRPYYGRRYGYYRRDRGSALAAGAVGLATGAIIGGALAQSQARANNVHAYCAQRFRSYDPASGTYLGYDGRRHPCP